MLRPVDGTMILISDRTTSIGGWDLPGRRPDLASGRQERFTAFDVSPKVRPKSSMRSDDICRVVYAEGAPEFPTNSLIGGPLGSYGRNCRNARLFSLKRCGARRRAIGVTPPSSPSSRRRRAAPPLKNAGGGGAYSHLRHRGGVVVQNRTEDSRPVHESLAPTNLYDR